MISETIRNQKDTSNVLKGAAVRAQERTSPSLSVRLRHPERGARRSGVEEETSRFSLFFHVSLYLSHSPPSLCRPYLPVYLLLFLPQGSPFSLLTMHTGMSSPPPALASPLESSITYGHTSCVWTTTAAAAPAALARSAFEAKVHTPRSMTSTLRAGVQGSAREGGDVGEGRGA